MIDMLLTNPKAALDWANSVRQQCEKEETSKQQAPFLERINIIVSRFAKKCPIFLLGECQEEGFGHCLLSRQYQPNFRQQFESHVAKSLNNQLLSLTRPVQYVSFACGGMFQDHVILTKTLAIKPDAQLDVHLIDINHAPYVKCRDLLNNTRSIDPLISTDPTPVMDALKKAAREHGAPQNMNDEELTLLLKNVCKLYEARTRQSIAWLSKTFPRARLKLYLHDTVDSYYQYIERAHIESPDVVATADIDDEMSLLKSSRLHYGQLCVRSLQKNPLANNIWLRKDAHGGTASLTSIKLKESTGSVKEDVEVQGVSIPAYITSQQINTNHSF